VVITFYTAIKYRNKYKYVVFFILYYVTIRHCRMRRQIVCTSCDSRGRSAGGSSECLKFQMGVQELGLCKRDMSHLPVPPWTARPLDLSVGICSRGFGLFTFVWKRLVAGVLLTCITTVMVFVGTVKTTIISVINPYRIYQMRDYVSAENFWRSYFNVLALRARFPFSRSVSYVKNYCLVVTNLKSVAPRIIDIIICVNTKHPSHPNS